MKIPTDFQFPPGATAPQVANLAKEIQLSQEFTRIYPYLSTIDVLRLQPAATPAEAIINDISFSRPKIATAKLLDFVLHPLKLRKRYELLLIIEDARPTERAVLCQLLLALSKAGLSILCVSTTYLRKERDYLQQQGCKNIDFIDFNERLYRWSRNATWHTFAENIAAQDWPLFRQMLNEAELAVPQVREKLIRNTARSKALWALLRKVIDFEIAIVRQHQSPLSVCMTLDAVAEGKEVVSFQHGVLSSLSFHIPTLTTKLLCCGQSSIETFQKQNHLWFSEIGQPEICKQYIPVGSITDPIEQLPDGWQHQTLLVLDQQGQNVGRYYGIEDQFDELFSSIETILRTVPRLQRILFRCHPGVTVGEKWASLVDTYPGRFEFTDARQPLSHDLKRCTVAVGFFSGALVSALACGVPTFFLWQDGWYFTPDLAAFTENFFVYSDEFPRLLEDILRSQAKYQDYREQAMTTAKLYYHQGQNCSFDSALIEKIIA